MKKNFSLLLTAIICIFSHSFLIAQVIKASVAMLPVHAQLGSDGRLHGAMTEVIYAINDVTPEIDISLSLLPFQRSLNDVIVGRQDFHIPLIRTPTAINNKHLPFHYVDECFTKVAFVLYTRSDKMKIDPNKLQQYVIETQRGHKDLFSFTVSEANTIAQGIGKLLLGRIHGYIMAQESTDDIIIKNKIKNIRRELYATWDACLVMTKTPSYPQLNKILSNALIKLKTKETFQAIIKRIHQPYDDWQPANMHW